MAGKQENLFKILEFPVEFWKYEGKILESNMQSRWKKWNKSRKFQFGANLRKKP